MIEDPKVVDLAAWKRKREEEELEELRTRVDELIDEHGDELEPKMYPSVFEDDLLKNWTMDDALGTINWFGPVHDAEINAWKSIKYTPTGLTTHADIVLEPNIASCSNTLAWVSYILNDMGMTKASDMVEDVIAVLDSKDNA